MSELQRLRRAGGGALKLIVDLLPEEWDPRSGYEDVCLIFADIAGYSDFVATEGDDAALAVLAVLEIQVQRALTGRRGARVVKRLGDGVMIVTRRNADAVDAALALVDGFDQHAAQAGWPVRLRAGMHRGSTRRQADDYFGYHVNLTARVADAAPGGRVLATANVLAGVDLSGLCITARPAGELRAKGVSGPVDLFVVQRLADALCDRLAG
jgi:adenylate cyclase